MAHKKEDMKPKTIGPKPLQKTVAAPTAQGATPAIDQEVKLPTFFDKHPDVKARMVAYLKEIPREQKQKSLQDFYKFINGDLTWGEIRKISKRMQKELARIAFLNFKMQRFEKAETLFKGLAVIDHTNWYYRSALGAVYQKKKLFEKAIDEYSTALELRESEVTSLVNRGECFLQLRDFDSALGDFNSVVHLNLPDNNPWHIRARVLRQRV